MGKELDIGESELLEICRSKGIHIWTCSAMRDLVNMILSKPIATAAAADADAVGLDWLYGSDWTVHSLPSETGLNGLPGMCTGLQMVRGVDSSIEKHWLVQLPDGRKISLKNENLTLVCSNAVCRANLLPPLLKCAKCKVTS